MRLRSALAGTALFVAAIASIATDRGFSFPQVAVDGPPIALQADRPQTYVVTVAYAGESELMAPMLTLAFDPRAGRWLGNPELRVTITDLTSGEQVADARDRQPFTVGCVQDCDGTASCSRSYRIGLELVRGREAEIDWTAALWFSERLDTGAPDSDDTGSEPVTATLTVTGPE